MSSFFMFDFMFNVMFVIFFVVFIVVTITIAMSAIGTAKKQHMDAEQTSVPHEVKMQEESKQKEELRCPYCGAPIHKDDQSCEYCGVKF